MYSGHIEYPSDEAIKSQPDALKNQLSLLQQSYSIAANVVRRHFSGLNAGFRTRRSVWSLWQAERGSAGQTRLQLGLQRVRVGFQHSSASPGCSRTDRQTAPRCWGFCNEHRELGGISFNTLFPETLGADFELNSDRCSWLSSLRAFSTRYPH